MQPHGCPLRQRASWLVSQPAKRLGYYHDPAVQIPGSSTIPCKHMAGHLSRSGQLAALALPSRGLQECTKQTKDGALLPTAHLLLFSGSPSLLLLAQLLLQGAQECAEVRRSAQECAGVRRSAPQLAGWLAGRLAGRLAGWLVGWLAGWLAGWLVGWLAGSTGSTCSAG